MVRIRVTYEPSGHADIGSSIPCAKAPPAPTLQEGLAQGVCRVDSLSTNLLHCRPTPPAPIFFIDGLLAHPILATTGIGLSRKRATCEQKATIPPHVSFPWCRGEAAWAVHFTMLRLLPKLALN